MAKDSQIKCSLCGRDKKDTKILIAGINGHVCDNCVHQAYNIVKDENYGEQKQQLQHSFNYKLPKAFTLAIPTPEHYLPLLYALALKEEDESISLFNDKVLAGSLTMTSLKISKEN